MEMGRGPDEPGGAKRLPEAARDLLGRVRRLGQDERAEGRIHTAHVRDPFEVPCISGQAAAADRIAPLRRYASW